MASAHVLLPLATAITNAAVLLVPCVILGWPTGSNLPRFLLMLGLLSAFCMGDTLAPNNFEPPTVGHRPTGADLRQQRLSFATGVVLLTILMLCVAALRWPNDWPMSWVGSVLMSAGVVLRWVAIQTLGHHFRTEIAVRQEQQLVRHGIYRWLRHPSELGLLLIPLGAATLAGSWLGITLVATALYPLVYLRVQAEEHELLAVWGKQYREYSRHTF